MLQQHPTKPFTITPEMEAEVDAEIAKLSPNVQEPHDPIGEIFGAPGIRRRNVAVGDRTGPTPGPSNHPQTSPPEDTINPSHYRRHPSGIECIEVTRHMNFNTGNAIKYIWRYLDKGDPVENLKKAQWYIDDEIRRLEGKR
jgi:Protein of unknwon function (DUF3310)